MILEKEKVTEQENKPETLNFIELVGLKRNEYKVKHLPFISYKEKLTFAFKNRKDIYDSPQFLFFIISILIAIPGLNDIIQSLNVLPHSYYSEPVSFYSAFISSLPFIIAALSLTGFTHTPFFKKAFTKIWILKRKNQKILESDMFLASLVSEDILKAFIKEYGQNELVNLMSGKVYLSYSDLFKYIRDKESREARFKLAEAVKCLAEKQGGI